MRRLINFLKTNPDFTIGLAMLIGIGIYTGYRQIMLKKHGIITIARVDRFESAEQGVNLYITIYFRDKEYKSMIDALCYGCEGKYFFIKIDSTKPELGGLLYENKVVPECIFTSKVPVNGWQKIPNEPCN